MTPAVFLDEAARVLAPGGILALRLRTRTVSRRGCSGPSGGVRSTITCTSFRGAAWALLESRGFAIAASVTWGGWARGLRPAFIKGPLDRLAKYLASGML